MTTAHIEPLAALVRVFSDGRSYGEPYDYVATLRWTDHETAEVMGALHAPLPSQWRAICIAAREVGIKRLLLTRRHPDGRTRQVEIELD